VEADRTSQFGTRPAAQNSPLFSGATEANAGNVFVGPRVGTQGLGIGTSPNRPDIGGTAGMNPDQIKSRAQEIMAGIHSRPTARQNYNDNGIFNRLPDGTVENPDSRIVATGRTDPGTGEPRLMDRQTGLPFFAGERQQVVDQGRQQYYDESKQRRQEKGLAGRAANYGRHYGLPPIAAQAGIGAMDRRNANPDAPFEPTQLERQGLGLPPEQPRTASPELIAQAQGYAAILSNPGASPESQATALAGLQALGSALPEPAPTGPMTNEEINAEYVEPYGGNPNVIAYKMQQEGKS